MSWRVGIFGATGAVGEKMREVLEASELPVTNLRCFASARSAGKNIRFRGADVTVETATKESLRGVDILLSSTPASVSREWSPVAASAGAIVIDNSSAWRMDPDVPLVVPEVNSAALTNIAKGIVANPNCSTIQMVVALKPLHDLARIKRIVVCTYQASSGKGATGLQDLDAQIAAMGRGEKVPPPTAHAARLAGNVITHDWRLGEDGYSEEELKMVHETRKILGDASILVSPTTVRVPVRTGHSEAIHVEFHSALSPEAARAALQKAAGVIVLDDYAAKKIPTPLDAEGRNEVFVGRIRKDATVPHGLALWVVADNLRKGAATNAVQIAEALWRLRR